MNVGVYRKVKASGYGKGTGIGLYYQLLLLARDYYSGVELVVYIPLRVEPEWQGTVRPCVLPRTDFEQMFTWVGEGLPYEG